MDPYLLEAFRLTCWLESDPPRASETFQALGKLEFRDIPNHPGWFTVMALLTEACVELDDRRHAENLYRLVLPRRNLIFVYEHHHVCWAAAEHYLGMLATVLERWDDAEDHFQRALKIHDEGGMRLWLAHTRYAYADMLVKCGEPPDQERALTLVDQALAEAEDMGAARLERKALALKVQIQGILKA